MSPVSEPLASYLFLAIAAIVAFVAAKVGVRIVTRMMKRLESQGKLSAELSDLGGCITSDAHLVGCSLLCPC